MIHMKRSIFILAVTLFLINPNLVCAEDSTSSPKPFVQRVQTAREEIKERSATREAERKERLDNLRKSIVTNFFDNMIKRLQAAEDRLNKILTRIESRVAKIKLENPSKDLTKVDADIALVKTKLADTQTKINTTKTDFDAMIASTAPKELFKTVKDDISAIKKDLQDIRRMLSQIIGEIKGLRVGETEKESPKP